VVTWTFRLPWLLQKNLPQITISYHSYFVEFLPHKCIDIQHHLYMFFHIVYHFLKLGLHPTMHFQWCSNWRKVKIWIYFHFLFKSYNIETRFHDTQIFHGIISNSINSITLNLIFTHLIYIKKFVNHLHQEIHEVVSILNIIF
jgi:hypothetical protein